MSKNSVNIKRGLRSVISAILLASIILTLSVSLIGCNKKDDFDYLTADLSEYIEFTEDYKNFEINIDLAKPHDIDVDVTILNMVSKDKNNQPLYGGLKLKDLVISGGDIVNIWYRGYLIGDDGEQIVVDGMSNFGNASPYTLEIGSNSFIPGFELNLVGIDTKDYPKFEKIVSGAVNEKQIAYVSYTRVKGNDDKTKTEFSNVRMVLSEDLDATYGKGFKDKLLSSTIGKKGELSTSINDEAYTYSNLTINFVTECEVNPIVVETYFGYDYSKADLRNETAYFEVYVVDGYEYECPEFDDTYLKNKIEKKEINVTLEELDKFEGETLVDKYRAFVNDSLDKIYQENYDSMVEEAVWNHLVEITKAKKYPTEKVEEIYNDYIEDIKYQFRSTGGQLYDNTTGQYKTHDTLDSFAKAYLGVTGTESWKDKVYAEAQNFVKERLMLFYILRDQNLMPTEAKYKEKYDEIIQQYIDEALDQYFYYAGTTRDDYTDEEYQDILEECEDIVYDNFDEEYFMIRTHYTILAETMVKWPKVITLDERRAYPQDK